MRITAATLSLLIFSLSAEGREAKEFDSDVNYDNTKNPHYDLPPLLITSHGQKITTADQWHNIRRPEILALFSNLVYGRVPKPSSPIRVEFEIAHSDPAFMDAAATRKDIKIHLSNNNGRLAMHVVLFVPNKASKPVPCFLKHSFQNTRSDDFRPALLRRGILRNGWPLEKLIRRGYALCAVYHEDLVKHNEVDFRDGIHKLFYPKGQSFPKAHEWGVLSTCAWGAMRAMDYLETDQDIDHNKVAVMGHSKMGKAALWTAAQDTRFALAISAQSGCAGAALWRRKSGETLKKMVTRFPYWLCRNAWKFVEQEDDLPVDQHMLLGCIAPRPVYVHSGINDTWADPRGEYLSAFHAGDVYRLLDRHVSLSDKASPPVGQAIIESHVGYHVRKGGHSIEPYDWDRFLEFADYHFKSQPE